MKKLLFICLVLLSANAYCGMTVQCSILEPKINVIVGDLAKSEVKCSIQGARNKSEADKFLNISEFCIIPLETPITLIPQGRCSGSKLVKKSGVDAANVFSLEFQYRPDKVGTKLFKLYRTIQGKRSLLLPDPNRIEVIAGDTKACTPPKVIFPDRLFAEPDYVLFEKYSFGLKPFKITYDSGDEICRFKSATISGKKSADGRIDGFSYTCDSQASCTDLYNKISVLVNQHPSVKEGDVEYHDLPVEYSYKYINHDGEEVEVKANNNGFIDKVTLQAQPQVIIGECYRPSNENVKFPKNFELADGSKQPIPKGQSSFKLKLSSKIDVNLQPGDCLIESASINIKDSGYTSSSELECNRIDSCNENISNEIRVTNRDFEEYKTVDIKSSCSFAYRTLNHGVINVSLHESDCPAINVAIEGSKQPPPPPQGSSLSLIYSEGISDTLYAQDKSKSKTVSFKYRPLLRFKNDSEESINISDVSVSLYNANKNGTEHRLAGFTKQCGKCDGSNMREVCTDLKKGECIEIKGSSQIGESECRLDQFCFTNKELLQQQNSVNLLTTTFAKSDGDKIENDFYIYGVDFIDSCLNPKLTVEGIENPEKFAKKFNDNLNYPCAAVRVMRNKKSIHKDKPIYVSFSAKPKPGADGKYVYYGNGDKGTYVCDKCDDSKPPEYYIFSAIDVNATGLGVLDYLKDNYSFSFRPNKDDSDYDSFVMYLNSYADSATMHITNYKLTKKTQPSPVEDSYLLIEPTFQPPGYKEGQEDYTANYFDMSYVDQAAMTARINMLSTHIPGKIVNQYYGLNKHFIRGEEFHTGLTQLIGAAKEIQKKDGSSYTPFSYLTRCKPQGDENKGSPCIKLGDGITEENFLRVVSLGKVREVPGFMPPEFEKANGEALKPFVDKLWEWMKRDNNYIYVDVSMNDGYTHDTNGNSYCILKGSLDEKDNLVFEPAVGDKFPNNNCMNHSKSIIDSDNYPYIKFGKFSNADKDNINEAVAKYKRDNPRATPEQIESFKKEKEDELKLEKYTYYIKDLKPDCPSKIPGDGSKCYDNLNCSGEDSNKCACQFAEKSIEIAKENDQHKGDPGYHPKTFENSTNCDRYSSDSNKECSLISMSKFKDCDIIGGAGSITCNLKTGMADEDYNYCKRGSPGGNGWPKLEAQRGLWGPNGSYRADIGKILSSYAIAGLLPLPGSEGYVMGKCNLNLGLGMNYQGHSDCHYFGGKMQRDMVFQGWSMKNVLKVEGIPYFGQSVYSYELSKIADVYNFAYGDFLGKDGTVAFVNEGNIKNDYPYGPPMTIILED